MNVLYDLGWELISVILRPLLKEDPKCDGHNLSFFPGFFKPHENVPLKGLISTQVCQQTIR